MRGGRVSRRSGSSTVSGRRPGQAGAGAWEEAGGLDDLGDAGGGGEAQEVDPADPGELAYRLDHLGGQGDALGALVAGGAHAGEDGAGNRPAGEGGGALPVGGGGGGGGA